MQLNTTSHATSQAKVTSHYWGYRELSAQEILAVAGGDISLPAQPDYSDGTYRYFPYDFSYGPFDYDHNTLPGNEYAFLTSGPTPSYGNSDRSDGSN